MWITLFRAYFKAKMLYFLEWNFQGPGLHHHSITSQSFKNRQTLEQFFEPLYHKFLDFVRKEWILFFLVSWLCSVLLFFSVILYSFRCSHQENYPLSQSELGALREFIDEHLNMGFICPSNSLFRAPVLFIKKKDSSLRLCVDFRRLNSITRKDKYPLPLVSDLLAAPSKAKFFTKIDLQHAYHLVRISPRD